MASNYYCPLLGGAPIKVRQTATKGKAVFATRPLKYGEVVIAEVPLQAMQSLPNRQDVLVCAGCHRFLGTHELQADLLARRCAPNALLPPQWSVNSDNNLPVERCAPFSEEIVGCPQGCGQTYCSRKCQAADFARSHRLLCVGPCKSADDPLMQFKLHACTSNEIFLLVARVIAHALARFEAIASSYGVGPETGQSSVAAWWDEAWEPYARFVQEPWWDVVCPGFSARYASESRGTSEERPAFGVGGECRETDEEDPDQLARVLLGLAEESAKLLADALLPGVTERLALNDEAVVALKERSLSTERFGRIVGMFEQNQLGVRVQSPLVHLCESLKSDGASGSLALRALSEAAVEIMRDGLFGEDDDAEDCAGVEEAGEEEGTTVAVGGGNKTDSASDFDSVEEATSTDDDVSVEGPVEATESEIALAQTLLCDNPSRIFAPLDGTALFSVVCCMNHSCEPNVEVVYNSACRTPLKAEVRVIKDTGIKKGEEVCFSYIDTALPLEDRRAALLDYGFDCACDRCVRETM